MWNHILALITGFALRLFDRAVQEVWDGLWKMIREAIVEAEEKWGEKDRGRAKKSQVQGFVMAHLEDRLSLNFVTRRLARLFVSRTLDSLIEELNEGMGKGWGKHPDKARDYLADRLPFVK